MVAKRGGERSAVYDPKKVEGAPGRRPLLSSNYLWRLIDEGYVPDAKGVLEKLCLAFPDDAVSILAASFEILYQSLTYLMREPLDYDRAVSCVLKLPKDASEYRRGGEILSKHEGELFIAYARNLDLLCRDYDRTYRILAWFVDRRGPENGAPLLVRIHSQHMRRLHDAQNRLQSYGKFALAA